MFPLFASQDKSPGRMLMGFHFDLPGLPASHTHTHTHMYYAVYALRLRPNFVSIPAPCSMLIHREEDRVMSGAKTVVLPLGPRGRAKWPGWQLQYLGWPNLLLDSLLVDCIHTAWW